MSIYTFLIVAMLLAMAFEKRLMFHLSLIVMVWWMLREGLKNDDNVLLFMVVFMVASILLIEMAHWKKEKDKGMNS
ncbi:hypothetical protein EalM137_00031 [Exiguobacterium phage vB_EalM-137]|nr:hypothetical protein EalM137_00031 [Exiguobacterium phage vB_EalM-137]